MGRVIKLVENEDYLMHRAHKYIRKYKSKSGKWVYVYKNEGKESDDLDVRDGLDKGDRYGGRADEEGYVNGVNKFVAGKNGITSFTNIKSNKVDGYGTIKYDYTDENGKVTKYTKTRQKGSAWLDSSITMKTANSVTTIKTTGKITQTIEKGKKKIASILSSVGK